MKISNFKIPFGFASSRWVAIFLLPLILVLGFVVRNKASGTALYSEEATVALEYISQKYDISISSLVIANEHTREYPDLGRTFRAFTLLELENNRFFDLLVDSNNLAIEEDVNAIRQANQAAHQAMYGKLDPVLFERLKTATDDELLEVAIWIVSEPFQTEQEYFERLAEMFPAAKVAREKTEDGLPFDVDDPELRREIELAYWQMLDADTESFLNPVIQFLQDEGFSVSKHGFLPSVTTAMPKHKILELANRPDVERIFLIEGKLSMLLNDAMPANDVWPVWQRGIG